MRPFTVTALLALLLAGCLGTPDAGRPDDPQDALPELPLWTDGALQMEVPLPVLLVGFSAEEADALAMALEKGERVVHLTMTINQPLPPDPEGSPEEHLPLDGESIPLPVVPTAVFEVTRLDPGLEAALGANVSAWDVKEGRMLEDWLGAALNGTEHEPDPTAPSLVLVHPGFRGADATWRYTFPQGHLEPVRSFGERLPMHIRILDDAELEELESWVRALVHYRFLQGSIYPMPLTECHAVTLITAYRPTTLGEHLPGLERAVDMFDPDGLAAAFTNLTGTTVHVDHQVLEMPVDDPVLDAILRGEYVTTDVQRAWFSMNWQDYHVAHEGCEPYLSFVVHGDLASAGTSIIGIGTYDGKGYRIALGWVNEAYRLTFDPASPAYLFGEGTHTYDWIDFLHAHEAGHIFGMHHPFHTLREDGVGQNNAFQDVWSTMSYSTDGRVIDFSMIDRNNFQRNSAAFVVEEAARLGLYGTPAWEAAFEALAVRDWNGAIGILAPEVAAQQGATGAAPGSSDGLVLFPKPLHRHGE